MSVKTYEDRSISVKPGQIIETGYAPIHMVKLGCKERMAVGDVDRAFQKRLQIAPNQPWPPPRGHWDGDDFFVIEDGRHEYVAALMLGCSHILVAWTVCNSNRPVEANYDEHGAAHPAQNKEKQHG